MQPCASAWLWDCGMQAPYKKPAPHTTAATTALVLTMLPVDQVAGVGWQMLAQTVESGDDLHKVDAVV